MYNTYDQFLTIWLLNWYWCYSALKEENDKWSQSKYEKVYTDQIYKNIPISFIHIFIQMSADHKNSFQEQLFSSPLLGVRAHKDTRITIRVWKEETEGMRRKDTREEMGDSFNCWE